MRVWLNLCRKNIKNSLPNSSPSNVVIFQALEMHRNPFSDGALFRTPQGELTMLPIHVSRLGRGTPLPSLPPRRLRRLGSNCMQQHDQLSLKVRRVYILFNLHRWSRVKWCAYLRSLLAAYRQWWEWRRYRSLFSTRSSNQTCPALINPAHCQVVCATAVE